MSSTLTPEVTWAQRSSESDVEKNYVFLTIVAADVPESKLKLDIQPTKVSFSGYSESKKADYAVELELYAEIDPSASKSRHSGRALELVLSKKEKKAEFWPRLLKDSKKQHFLKTDFDKWVDEDEQEEAGDADNDYMSQMNAMGGGGGGDGGFGGIDFSKLGGGAGGMPDLSSLGGMGGMGGDDAGDDDDDDEDDEMPELEEADKTEAAPAAGKAKIQEVE